MDKNNDPKNSISLFWGKKQDKNGILKWLPLKQHLLDTKNVAGLLWEHWLSQKQRDVVAASLDEKSEEIAKRLTCFLGVTHDIAKASPAFQIKSFYDSKDLDQELLERLERCGFTGLSTLALASASRSPHAAASQVLLESYGVNQGIASIVGAHHGKPTDDLRLCKSQLRSYTANYFQVEQADHPVYQKWDWIQKELFTWGLAQAGFKDAADVPTMKQPGQIILAGLLVMADWIASNEKFFPLILLEQKAVEDQASRIEHGWQEWFGTYLWEPRRLEDVNCFYQSSFGFKPRAAQVIFSNAVQSAVQPGVFIFEAPMGIGKTEAALAAVEQLAEKTGCNGMYFGLPTQATSDGIFPRILEWLHNSGSNVGEVKSIQLVHGKAALNDKFAALTKASNIADEEVIVNSWFSGRRTAVLDDFVVGTIDQFLMMALKQKHLALRHLGFSKKVVVIDEVHAYDAYMSQFLARALVWLGAYGIPVVILSATLPAKGRVELIKSYMKGTGVKFNREVKKPDGWDSTEAYPILTYSDGLEVKQITDFPVDAGRKVEVKRLNEDHLLDKVDDLLSDGGVAGIIVNTVKRAQELAGEFIGKFGEEMVEILHSGFISTDRIEKEKHLLELIGKDAKRPERKIIIGTQVIEQSLDINFDVLISDLAPMDLLLQRLGRLHRHILSERPEKLKNPLLFVLGTDDNFEFDGGSSAVYGDYLLMRTQFYLPNWINLPNDISLLVQIVYNDEDIDFKDEEKYNRFKNDYQGRIKKKKEKAKNFQLKNPGNSNKDNLVEWLNNDEPDDSEARGIARVRDSSDSIEVIVVKRFAGGYAMFGKEENIADQIGDHQVAKELAKHTLRLPNQLSKNYNIDGTIRKLEEKNLEELAAWQNQEWLKGSLGLIFDEHNQCMLNGFRLTYDKKIGLTYEKEERDG